MGVEIAGAQLLEESAESPLRAQHPHMELLDGLTAGDLALGMPPDTVGNDVEPESIVTKERVLVEGPTTADVGLSD